MRNRRKEQDSLPTSSYPSSSSIKIRIVMHEIQGTIHSFLFFLQQNVTTAKRINNIKSMKKTKSGIGMNDDRECIWKRNKNCWKRRQHHSLSLPLETHVTFEWCFTCSHDKASKFRRKTGANNKGRQERFLRLGWKNDFQEDFADEKSKESQRNLRLEAKSNQDWEPMNLCTKKLLQLHFISSLLLHLNSFPMNLKLTQR